MNTPVSRGLADPIKIVGSARSWIGTPYRHQASLKTVGCDCLGLVRGVWREVVGPEPEATPAYSPDWAEASGADTLLAMANKYFTPIAIADMAAGHLLIFRWRDNLPAKHAGIATGPTTLVHAHDGASVCEVSLNPGWRRRISGVFAFPAPSA